MPKHRRGFSTQRGKKRASQKSQILGWRTITPHQSHPRRLKRALRVPPRPLLSGLAQGGLPEWSVGYVYLPAVLGIAFTSVLLAPAGAALAHRLKTRTLKRMVAGLLFVMATKMLITLW